MTLSDIAPGGRFVVSRVKVGGEIGRRLADMGFTEGAEGEMIRGALMRGPLQVRVRGCDLLIRRGEASCVDVEPTLDGGAEAAGLRGAPGAGKAARTREGQAGGPHGRGWRGFGRGFRGLFGEPDCCAPSRPMRPGGRGGARGIRPWRGAGKDSGETGEPR
jgi:ferrous iron transport protein A